MKSKRILAAVLALGLLFSLAGCDSVEKQHEVMETGDEETRVQAVRKIAELSIDNNEFNLYRELLPYLEDESGEVRSQVIREYWNAYQTYGQSDSEDAKARNAQNLSQAALHAIAAYAVGGGPDLETRELAAALYDDNRGKDQSDEEFLGELLRIWAQYPEDAFSYDYMSQAEYDCTDDVIGYILVQLDDAYDTFYQSKGRAPNTQEFLSLMDADLCAIIRSALVLEKNKQEDALYRTLLARLTVAGTYTDAGEMMTALYLLSDAQVQSEVSGEDLLPALQAIMEGAQSIYWTYRLQIRMFVAYIVKQNQEIQDAVIAAMADDIGMFRFYCSLTEYGYGNAPQMFAALAEAEGQTRREMCGIMIGDRVENGSASRLYLPVITELKERFTELPEYIREYIYLAAFYAEGRGCLDDPAFDPGWSTAEVFRELFLSHKPDRDYLENLMNNVLTEEDRAFVYDSIVQTIYAGVYTLDDYAWDVIWKNGAWHGLLTDYLDRQFEAREEALLEASVNPTLKEGADRIKVYSVNTDTFFSEYPDLDASYLALQPDDARYIIGYDEEPEVVGTYMPQDGSASFDAVRIDVELFVIDKLTGEKISHGKIKGNDPPDSITTTSNTFSGRSTIREDSVYKCFAIIYRELTGAPEEQAAE